MIATKIVVSIGEGAPGLVIPVSRVVSKEREGSIMRWMHLSWLISLPSHIMASAVAATLLQFCKRQIEQWRVMVRDALDC